MSRLRETAHQWRGVGSEMLDIVMPERRTERRLAVAERECEELRALLRQVHRALTVASDAGLAVFYINTSDLLDP